MPPRREISIYTLISSNKRHICIYFVAHRSLCKSKSLSAWDNRKISQSACIDLHVAGVSYVQRFGQCCQYIYQRLIPVRDTYTALLSPTAYCRPPRWPPNVFLLVSPPWCLTGLLSLLFFPFALYFQSQSHPRPLISQLAWVAARYLVYPVASRVHGHGWLPSTRLSYGNSSGEKIREHSGLWPTVMFGVLGHEAIQLFVTLCGKLTIHGRALVPRAATRRVTAVHNLV